MFYNILCRNYDVLQYFVQGPWCEEDALLSVEDNLHLELFVPHQYNRSLLFLAFPAGRILPAGIAKLDVSDFGLW